MGWLAKVGAKLKQWFPPEPNPDAPKEIIAKSGTKPPRKYPPLPYTVSAWKVPILSRMLVQSSIWNRLPYGVGVKINAAVSKGTSLVITKGDLDSISDSVWLEIEGHFK